ncbi:deoxyguanosinetriphosphate triphosphohydrolase [Fulvivirga sp. 29W222]|uniref:Deoxyguanosinetriphosphate triphosphohydrolase n=2 Tax=Fulvivirga marina TaxID=2494733 RepID=A0A937KE98_9BACT|nr:deoxyguanosinetriphosphate triphosphohydrolase [Fulvivirga marina]MBL6449896.1 deoxyguanosinetriphosphate triphosphohydrolase [Fulvivirga marina]
MNWEQLLSNQRSGQKPKEHDISRSAFEQDYDRIIFSHPFRRLQDKTQVHPLPEYDFVHTRLTHSLEVSSVGRTLGKRAGQVLLERHKELKDKFSVHDFGAIVAAASLAHDIGNPPFGHSGEDAISEFFLYHDQGKHFKEYVTDWQWQDLTNFEGNAQGFRILNKERYQGLKLTYATLAAFSKYPRKSLIDSQDKERRSQKKYGFFQSESSLFSAMAEDMGLIKYGDNVWSRHPMAFLVEAADDICYQLIDLEDGCRLGLVSYDDTVELYAGILQEKFDKKKLERIESFDERIGTLRALSIGVLIEESCTLFLDEEENLLKGIFDTALTDTIKSTPILQDIEKLSIEKIYRARTVMETEAAGFEVLPGLLAAFVTAAHEKMNGGVLTKKNQSALRLMPSEVRREISEDANMYQVLMSCIDFVSGMTDTHAISLFRKIKGISLPNG